MMLSIPIIPRLMRHFLWCFSVLLCLHTPAQALSFIEVHKDGLSGVNGLAAASSVSATPDGQFVYTTGFSDNAVSIFQRNTSTGKLTYVSSSIHGSGGVTNLQGPNDVLISPDGAHLYVASFFSNAIVSFSRDTSTGALTQVGSQVDNANGVSGLLGVGALAMDADGKYLYAAGFSDNAIVVFSRNTGTGALSFVEVKQSISGLNYVSSILISPDGNYVYATGNNDNAVVQFQRNSTTGRLTYQNTYINDSNGISSMSGPYQMAFDANANRLFVAATTSSSIVVFDRNSGTGALTFSNAYVNNTGDIVGLGGVRALTVNDAGDRLYAVGNSGNSLVEFSIQAQSETDDLVYVSRMLNDSNGVSGLDGPTDVSLASAGQHIYATGGTSNSLVMFATSATDLKLSVTAPSQAQVGLAFSYDLTVTNQGPLAATFVVFSNTLSEDLSYVSSSSGNGVSCDAVGQVVTCSVGTLAVDASASVSVSVTSNQTGTASNAIVATGAQLDPNSSDNSITASTSVVSELPVADLSVSMSANVNPVNTSSHLVYSFVVGNAGPQAAEQTKLQLSLGSGASFVSGTASQGTCSTLTTQIISCSLNTIASGSQATASVTISAPSTAGTLTSSATVSSALDDNSSANNTASVNTTVSSLSTNLQIASLTASAATIAVGDTVTYQAVVGNLSAQATSDVVVTDLFSPAAGMELVSSSTTAVNAPSPSSPCSESPRGQINCQLGTLNAFGNNSTANLSLTVRAIQGGTLASQATISGNANDTNTSNDSQVISTEVSGEVADVSVAVTASANPIALGENLTYTVTVANVSTANSASNVTLTSSLDSNVTFVSATPEQGSCSFSLGTVNCALESLGVSASTKVVIVVTPSSVGTVSHSAQVGTSSFDSDSSNDSASLNVTVGSASADISVSASAGVDTVLVGDSLTYTTTVSNAGPNAASDITLTSTLSTNATLVSASTSQGSCSQSGQTWACAIGSLAANAAATLSFVALPTEAGTLVNSLSVLSPVADADDSNNTKTLETRASEAQSLIFDAAYRDGINGLDGLQGAYAVTYSSDGLYVYVAGFYDDAIAVFQRDTSTEVLTQIQVVRNGAASVVGLSRPTDIQLSDDNKYLYISSYGSASLLAFSRDADTGTLSFAQQLQQGSNGIDGLSGMFAVATSGSYVYTVGFNSNAVNVFVADSSGTLSLQESHVSGSNGISNMTGPVDLDISPDGSRVYVGALSSNALVVFNRNTSTGGLSFVQSFVDGVGGVTGISQVNGVVVSPDNAHIYVAGSGSNSIGIFSQALSFVGSVTDADNLGGVAHLAFSQDGSYLYAASTTVGRLPVYSRNASTGALNFISAVVDGDNGAVLTGVRDIAVAESTLFVASLDASALSVFRLPVADLQLSMTSSVSEIALGNTLNFTATVKNQGPDTATATSVVLTLPTGMEFVSVNPSQGSCLSPTGLSVSCTLGSLSVSGSAAVIISVRTTAQGSLTASATASASQSDLTSPNTAQVSVEVTGVADLNVSQSLSVDSIPVNSQASFVVQIVNQGPNDATGLIISNVLPVNAELISVSSNTIICDDASGTQLSCTLASLASQGEASLTITVKALQEGAMTNSVSVTAEQDDPSLPNTSTQSLTVVSNIIDTAYDNTGAVLQDYQIAATGSVTGGSLAGSIVNYGSVQDVTLLSGATVSGGGKISGSIISQGTIENATLLSGTIINGGTVRGNITGSSDSPATINATVADGAQLSYVIIGSTATLGSGITLGAGVQFASNSNVPADTSLTNTLGSLQEPVTLAQAVYLGSDIVVGNLSLTEGINALSVMRNNNWTLAQNSNGHVEVPVDVLTFSTIPWQVRQAVSGYSSGLVLGSDETAVFTTSQGREIYLRPAAHSPDGLLAALQNFGLSSVLADSSNNLRIAAGGVRFVARPAIQTNPASGQLENSIEFTETGLLTNTYYAQLYYRDSAQQLRSQTFYPALQEPAQFAQYLSEQGASQVSLGSNGLLRFVLNGELIEAVVDYSVTIGDGTGSSLQLLPVADGNGDGVADYQIRYAGGDLQYLFVIPPPDVVEEIAAIPEIVNAGFTVTRNSSDSMIMLLDTQAALLALGNITVADDGDSEGFTLNLDGSVHFVTASLRQVTAYPLVQDMDALTSVMASFGLNAPIEYRQQGYVRLNIDSSNYFAARPGLFSQVVSGKAPGLQGAAGQVNGQTLYSLVFTDSNGQLREQWLYPTTPAQSSLETYLLSRNSTTSVSIYSDGTVLTQGGTSPIKGVLGYLVNTEVVPADALQFTTLPDTNGDGLVDYAILYGEGGMQILYQLAQ